VSIRIVIADDQKTVRSGVRKIIENADDMEVIAEAGDGLKTIEIVKEFLPDVVILDMIMPRLNGIEVTQRIRSGSPGVKVIALSVYSDERYVLGMINAGASGYILKEDVFRELCVAVRTVVKDENYVSKGLRKLNRISL